MKVTEREERIIRSGNMLHGVGVWRALLANDGTLTKERFVFLIKKNYFLNVNHPLSIHMMNRVNKAWDKSKYLIRDLRLIIEHNDKIIRIEDPKKKMFRASRK